MGIGIIMAIVLQGSGSDGGQMSTIQPGLPLSIKGRPSSDHGDMILIHAEVEIREKSQCKESGRRQAQRNMTQMTTVSKASSGWQG